MESNSAPNCINISRAAYDALADQACHQSVVFTFLAIPEEPERNRSDQAIILQHRSSAANYPRPLDTN